MALIGAVAFLITFLALIQGTSEDSVFGYGFLPGVLALAIWSIATSIAQYRNVGASGWTQPPVAAESTEIIAQASSVLRRGSARTWWRSPCLPSRLRISTGSFPAGPNQCGRLGVELGHLAGAHRDVVAAEDQPQLPGEHVEPLVALVRAQLGLALLRRDDHLPRMQAARLLGQRDEDTALADSRLEPDAWVAHLRCADQLVQRHLMGLRNRQEQFEAGLPLAGLKPRQGALRDPRRRGQLGQRDSPPGTDPLQARADFGQHGRDRRGALHPSRKPARSRKWQRTLPNRAASRARLIAWTEDSFDVVVVGGGAAGLSAALVLGRARRRVAVVDAGMPRNAPAAHMQGFLSRDGMAPADFLAAGRTEVRRLRRRAHRGPGGRDRAGLHAPPRRRPSLERATAPGRDGRSR